LPWLVHDGQILGLSDDWMIKDAQSLLLGVCLAAGVTLQVAFAFLSEGLVDGVNFEVECFEFAFALALFLFD